MSNAEACKKACNNEENQQHFPGAEEAQLLAQSASLKDIANKAFTRADYSQAISDYDKALAVCPHYLEYEIAVLKSNTAACHLKQEAWQLAIDAAGQALDCLERLVPIVRPPGKSSVNSSSGKTSSHAVPLSDSSPQKLGPEDKVGTATIPLDLPLSVPNTSKTIQSVDTIQRLQAKLLLRRARARSHLQTWASLSSAEADYALLFFNPASSAVQSVDRPSISSVKDSDAVSTMKPNPLLTTDPPHSPLSAHLSTVDCQHARREMSVDLPPRVKQVREQEMGEMMGKLKDLGNNLLKPFGLNTDMFKMEKGSGGGYNMTMNP